MRHLAQPSILALVACLGLILEPYCYARVQAKPSVFVSILPQAYIVTRVAGDLVSVHTLVGPGASPATYEPTPRQMATLSRADAYFTVGGLPFERTFAGKIQRLLPKLCVVEMGRTVKRRLMTAHHCAKDREHEREHAHGGAPDPHIWLNTTNIQAMAEVVGNTLTTLLPKHRQHFIDNIAALNEELLSLHKSIRTQLEPFKGRKVFVFHPAFGYFIEAYGLEQVPIELEGKEPSPRQLGLLIREARSQRAKVIFVQRQFSEKSAQTLALSIGGTVRPLDPLAFDLLAGLEAMASAIANGIKGETTR